MAQSQAQRRVAFARVEPGNRKSRADELAAQVAPHLKRRDPARGWTARAVWYEHDSTLMAVVGEQEEGHTDLALAHGLELARDRALILVLHEDWAGPTLHRMPWLTTPLTVFTYADGSPATRAEPPTRSASRRQAGGPETSPALHLGEMGRSLRPLLEWAAVHAELEPAHTRSVRSWAHRGQRVLTVSGRKKVTVTAGIDARSQRAHQVTLTTAPTAAQVGEIRSHVETGIAQAKAKAFGSFEEHHLQAVLRQRPGDLRLEHPLLREVPAWRPVGSGTGKTRGRGFVDLAGLDPVGDLVVVETKLDDDDMLVLQGLDYWIWATATENSTWLRSRLHARPDAEVRLLYAVAGKDGKKPALSRYTHAQLRALHSDVPWRWANIENWVDGPTAVSLLDPGQVP